MYVALTRADVGEASSLAGVDVGCRRSKRTWACL